MTPIAKKDKKKGRPKGRKDSKPRKTKKQMAEIRSKASKKAAETRRRQKAEQQPPEVTPYPQAKENPEFEGLLDGLDRKADQPVPAGQPGPGPGDQLLDPGDIAEWVAWPFMTWAQYNKLPYLKLTDQEARSVAQPLTNILNRHGVGDVIPPDLLDGLKLAGRITPIMQHRFNLIKAERAKRAGQDGQAKQPAAPIKEDRRPANVKQGISVEELKNPKV